MKKPLRYTLGAAVIALLCMGDDCNGQQQPLADQIQRQQQERIEREGTSQVGMPAIVNFRERKLLKEIYEMRDQASFVTYTYLWNEMQGKLVFFCQSIGYPIPYSTEFTSPGKPVESRIGVQGVALTTVPQADPNGLFSPAAADGTWVLCKEPNSDKVQPVYVEPRVTTSPFKLATDIVASK